MTLVAAAAAARCCLRYCRRKIAAVVAVAPRPGSHRCSVTAAAGRSHRCIGVAAADHCPSSHIAAAEAAVLAGACSKSRNRRFRNPSRTDARSRRTARRCCHHTVAVAAPAAVEWQARKRLAAAGRRETRLSCHCRIASGRRSGPVVAAVAGPLRIAAVGVVAAVADCTGVVAARRCSGRQRAMGLVAGLNR